MKKVLWIILNIVFTLIILGCIFFAIGLNRTKNGKAPMFCISNPAGVYMDGGTREYFGLGYKIIKFNRLSGYNETKIGSWFMQYEDFDEEINAFETSPIYLSSAKDPEDKIQLNNEDADYIKILFRNLQFNQEPTNTTITYIFEYADGTKYYLKPDTGTIMKEDKESKIDSEDLNTINTIIQNAMAID